jgi:integrase/recombinase XerD
MEVHLRLQQRPRAWLKQSKLDAHVSGYCTYLDTHHYAATTQRMYLACVVHFAHWIHEERLILARLDEGDVARYLTEHLPRCGCPPPVRRAVHINRAALSHLLATLRASGTIAPRRKAHEQIESELDRFDAYMRHVEGFADSTIAYRVSLVRRFLSGARGSKPLARGRLSAAWVGRFIGDHRGRCNPGSMHAVVGAVRGYLRFRAADGDKVRAFLDAIPSVAHWRLATIPDVLGEVEIENLLGSFDRPFPSSRRAYAILRCLVDLGLRTSEVVRLRLDDIDWQAGTIRLAKPKSRRVDILPLPRETGRAISRYLVAERPQTTNRAVFVRHVAPRDQPIGSHVVSKAVRAAYRRCGLSHTRVHILRHSVASRLLKAGTPLKEIADVLRHRSLNTSAIYTKIDVARLAAVALPWPGSAA